MNERFLLIKNKSITHTSTPLAHSTKTLTITRLKQSTLQLSQQVKNKRERALLLKKEKKYI